MKSVSWRWVLGLTYIVAVSSIWIAASFVVQSVVDAGVSPFLVTYICNSLFVIFIPLVEIGRYLEDKYGSILFWRNSIGSSLWESEEIVLLQGSGAEVELRDFNGEDVFLGTVVDGRVRQGIDEKGRWTRARLAKVSLVICPFWFLAQLAFNISLKYTTVTSNTILSSSSSLFTFLVALLFLGEKFTWIKLSSVLLCMGGTIIVSLGDSKTESRDIAPNPALGDILSLLSAAMYAVYITLIRKKLPDDDGREGHVSMAQFLGFLGLFNLLIFLPIAIVLDFTKMEPFLALTWKQFGLIVGKGLLDNVLSDYLWAKAVLLTSTTVASAGLSIQVPLAAVVDSVTGNVPSAMDWVGAAAITVGFAGINIPSDIFSKPEQPSIKLEHQNPNSPDQE